MVGGKGKELQFMVTGLQRWARMKSQKGRVGYKKRFGAEKKGKKKS